jgi:hypothetical protein
MNPARGREFAKHRTERKLSDLILDEQDRCASNPRDLDGDRRRAAAGSGGQ